MSANVKNFLLLNAGILVLVALYMYFGKSRKPKSKFSLSNGKKTNYKVPIVSRDLPTEAPENAQNKSREKTLNVIFQFNGHSFEAYESLGLPAGSSIDKVEKAYREAIKNTPDSEAQLLHFAYQAIIKSN